MPVYKEGLEAVIVPTIESLKKAITTYERQGGTVSILVCEDGMQLWSEADAEVRKAYYDRNAIGWVARPKHGKDGFLRKGRFKKASNMNFALALSLRIEEIMDEIRPVPAEDEKDDWIWTDDDEGEIYEEALQRGLEETNGIAWAAGNVRIGEYILIIDSDTRVPEDCFMDAAAELDASPEIAIIQHESGAFPFCFSLSCCELQLTSPPLRTDVMLVIGHYFENGIAHFTRRINKVRSPVKHPLPKRQILTQACAPLVLPARPSRSVAPTERSPLSSVTTPSSDGRPFRTLASSTPTTDSPRSGPRRTSLRISTCRFDCRCEDTRSDGPPTRTEGSRRVSLSLVMTS